VFSFAIAYIIAIASLARKAAKPTCKSHHRKIVIFGTDTDPKKHSSIVESCGGCVTKPLPLINAAACVFPEEDQAMALLKRHGEVKWIEDDTVFAIVGIPVPHVKECTRCFGGKGPGFSTQETPWGVARIGAPSAWAHVTGKGVRVGVVDTGVNMSHLDLAGNVKAGFDAISETEGVEDDNGHGTHVAGIIAAADNGFGVVGVAPEAHIYAAKSFDSKGKGMASDIIQGIAWCMEQGVRVINMSFGTVDSGKALELAISKAAEAGILLVAASGNTGGQNSVLYPARDPHVVAVAASTKDDQIAAFSSSGPEVDITGPGTDVYSTYTGQRYKTLSGTSMACPHVTGVAALVLSGVPDLSAKEVEGLICETATVITGFPREQQGAGLVSAGAAVASVIKNRL
jgi:subtilisin family serine protease